MKKRVAFLGTGLAAGAICTAMAMNVFAAQITADRAKEIAMANAGVKAENVAYITAHLDFEKGQQIYDVEFFTTDYKEYDYEISANTGAVLEMDYDAEITYYYGGNGAAAGSQTTVTAEQAKAKALEHAGVQAENIPFINVILDYDDGRMVYDVEFYTNDYKEYDYEIDATTGAIVSWDYDAELFYQGTPVYNGNVPQASGQTFQAGITAEQAKAEALKMAGLADSQVRWGMVGLDYDDGRMVYEGKFFFETMEYEFELDANTGNIVDWDVESIYD